MIKLNSSHEKDIARKCLKASLDEIFFPDWEFHTLFGLSKKEVAEIVENWDHTDLNSEIAQLAINNAFANLLGYPHGQEKKLEGILGISSDELKKTFQAIKK
jgi:hypothetical protein